MDKDDWLEYVFNDEPSPITYRQLVIIESMIDRTSIESRENLKFVVIR
jgi:hypothetical protein